VKTFERILLALLLAFVLCMAIAAWDFASSVWEWDHHPIAKIGSIVGWHPGELWGVVKKKRDERRKEPHGPYREITPLTEDQFKRLQDALRRGDKAEVERLQEEFREDR
jgi:hypothetical protein